jgi:hypothetical protein
LRQDKSDMMASKNGRQGEYASNDGAQDRRPRHGESDSGDCQRDATSGHGNKGRAEQAGTTVEGPTADIDRDEKRQRVNGQREDQPAEHANSSDIKEKPKGKHGGGSMCIDVMVAPSTTTAAQGGV